VPDIQQLAADFGIPSADARNIDPSSPVPIRMMAAMGTVPVAPAVLISIQYVLIGDPDKGVSAAAQKSLKEMPVGLLVKNIGVSTHAKLLEFLAFNRTEETLLETIVLRRQTNDKTICYLAETASPRILEIIVGNQERTLVTPEITLHVKANPECPAALLDKLISWQRMNGIELEVEELQEAPPPAADEASLDDSVLGDDEEYSFEDEYSEASDLYPAAPAPVLDDDDPVLLLLSFFGIDIRPEFFDQQPAAAPVLEGTEEEQRLASRAAIEVDGQDNVVSLMTPLADMNFQFSLESNDDDWDASLTMDHGDSVDDDTKVSIAQEIAKLTVGQKIKLSYVGNKEVRDILIRDSNKMVTSAVVKSGRLTDPEVAKLAANRAVNEEVLRLVAQNKEWTRAYPIKVALINNPKCPVGTAMSFLPHLHIKDLKMLANNRNVSSVVFTMAKKRLKAKGPR